MNILVAKKRSSRTECRRSQVEYTVWKRVLGWDGSIRENITRFITKIVQPWQFGRPVYHIQHSVTLQQIIVLFIIFNTENE